MNVKASAIVTLVATATGVHAYSFADITSWTGAGSNQAALVIDWKVPGRSSRAWGYRFDGLRTGQDMLNAVKSTDSRLYTELVPGVGYTAIFGIGYDVDGDGFSKTDTDDLYAEGWFTNGFWAYYTDPAPSDQFPSWTFGVSGFDTRVLTNGSWDGWSWGQDFNATNPTAPVPEPAPVLVLGLATLTVLRRRLTPDKHRTNPNRS